MMPEAEARAAVVQEALAWIGTPYHHRARVKCAGVDCGMILLEVFHRAGIIPHVDPGDYPHDWMLHRDGERFLGWVEQFARRLPDGQDPRPGDLVLYRFGRCISHGAIVVEWPRIVHAYAVPGEVVMEDATANLQLDARRVGFWSVWAGGEA